MGLKIYINTDTQDEILGTSGIDWVEFSEGNDQIVFTSGNTEVQDGADTPSQAELISAGIILDDNQVILDTYLLQDTSENLLKSVDNMGNLNKSYVVAFSFDSSTASEPTFEVWDNANLNSANGAFLGSGTPSSSFVRV